MTKYQPVTSPYKEGLEVLEEDYNFNFYGLNLTIPSGFVFDGASVPKVFWSLVDSPFSPKMKRSALIHDFLYSELFDLEMNRLTKDQYFYSSLIADGNSKTKSRILFWAVRFFGGAHNES